MGRAYHAVQAASVNQPGEAFDDLYYLERCCWKQWLAAHYGRPLAIIARDIAEATKDWFGPSYSVYKRTHFDALKRVLDRDQPDYAT